MHNFKNYITISLLFVVVLVVNNVFASGEGIAVLYPDIREPYRSVFTNIIDHSLYPRKMCKEIERVLSENGIGIIHIQLGDDLDDYTETKIYNELELINYFSKSKVLKSNPIANLHDSMNWEIIIKKNSLY